MNIISIFQMIIAVALIAVILLQNRGTGAGSVLGGGGGDTVFNEKRGIDKKLYQATIVLSLIFVGLAIANLTL